MFKTSPRQCNSGQYRAHNVTLLLLLLKIQIFLAHSILDSPPHYNDKSSSITVVGSDDPAPPPAPSQIPIPISPVLDPPPPRHSRMSGEKLAHHSTTADAEYVYGPQKRANAGIQGQCRQQQTQQAPEKKDQAQVQHIERVEVKSTGGDGEIQLVQIQLDEAAAGEHGDGQGEEVEYASD
ncbi:hypothetical protein VKT23_020184 [Stygiomarasmius scandens]|uniref:Uncharacterized protein n=1 Tax=Marasmiellus scandens TaxID=2682957 RepID=A0ABR1IJK7_9AGAR